MKAETDSISTSVKGVKGDRMLYIFTITVIFITNNNYKKEKYKNVHERPTYKLLQALSQLNQPWPLLIQTENY